MRENDMPKVIIAGSRDFDNYKKLENRCLHILEKYSQKDVVVISGTAKGADKLGEQFAKKFGLELDKHPADWDNYGPSAGYVRNEEMANIADILIAFWDGESRGTRHMIKLARNKGLEVHTIRYLNES